MNLKRMFRALWGRKKSLGETAEDRAADYLKRAAGLKILARNWRFGRYETDIVAFDAETDTIVFAEVKCRPVYAKVAGYYAATGRRKADCLKKCASAFVAKKRLRDKNRRFDVLEVNHDGKGNVVEINHFENVRL